MSREKDHGRGEERRVWVSRHLDFLEEAAYWAGLAAVVCVQTRRWQQGRQQQSIRYYLTSLAQASAGELAGYIRGHWSIEKQLHWPWMSPLPRMPAAAAWATPRATSPPCASWPSPSYDETPPRR